MHVLRQWYRSRADGGTRGIGWISISAKIDFVMSSISVLHVKFHKTLQARRQRGFKGIQRTALLPPKDVYTTFLYVINTLPFVLASLPLRIATVQMSLVAAMHPVYLWRTSG